MFFRHSISFLSALSLGMSTAMAAVQPRIVNIINFVRQNDFRVENSEALLYEATEREFELSRKYSLPSTFLLQYDALVDPKYQALFKDAGPDIEVGAWWEITQPQAEAAGLEWNLPHPWYPSSTKDFGIGYTQEERARLVDAYMAKFKEIFGYYPKSVGSWYIDAYTLNYMYEHYGIVASCNCKDQYGTDGYTLWGGYWSQAYYPSKVNGYMPAQTVKGQIPVPVFRMLGSDPIYQYDSGLGNNGQGVVTLEPVYAEGGANKEWVEYFFDAILNQPCLAFSYAQAGQENSFTWNSIEKGYSMQIPMIADMVRQGKAQVLTLGESGEWFRKHFRTTPCTSVVSEKDIRNEGRKTVWFDSKFYRANILLDKDKSLRFRDIHVFNENMKSEYFDRKGSSTKFVFETLPVVDGLLWSSQDHVAGLRFVQLESGGRSAEIAFSETSVSEAGREKLLVSCTAVDGSIFRILFGEKDIQVSSDSNLAWALELTAASGIASLPFKSLALDSVNAEYNGVRYAVEVAKGQVEKPSKTSAFVFRFHPEQNSLRIKFQ
jgi:hypothetical protein